jgi:hypothetical protein
LIRIFIPAIFSSRRRRAGAYGIPRGLCGAVAFVQRFGSGLNLHPHVHVLVLDGVLAGLEAQTPRFYSLRAPDDADVTAAAGWNQRSLESKGHIVGEIVRIDDLTAYIIVALRIPHT